MRHPMAWIGRQVAVAAAYAFGYWLFREISVPHWLPLAGFRMLCLILMPTRYWGALVIAELVPNCLRSWEFVESYGTTWALLNLVPAIAMVIPVMTFFRDAFKYDTRQSGEQLNARKLLLCVFCASIATMVLNLASVYAATFPTDYHLPSFDVLISQVFLGECLGMLTVVPVGLWMRGLLALNDRHPRGVVWRPLLKDTVLFLVPVLLLVIFGQQLSEIFSSLKMLMFVPVILMAWRHGWQGAALSGSLASIATMLMMPELFDVTTMQAEVFIAFAMSTMLLFGAHVTAWRLDIKSRERRVEDRRELSALGLIVDGDSYINSRMVLDRSGQLRVGARPMDISSDMHGSTMDGLLTSLSSAGIDANFKEAFPAAMVSLPLQRAADRLALAAVAYILKHQRANRFSIDCRRASSNKGEWLAVRVTAHVCSQKVLSGEEVSVLLDHLNIAIHPLWLLRRLAQTYYGYLRLRVTEGHMRIAFLIKALPDKAEVVINDPPRLSFG